MKNPLTTHHSPLTTSLLALLMLAGCAGSGVSTTNTFAGAYRGDRMTLTIAPGGSVTGSYHLAQLLGSLAGNNLTGTVYAPPPSTSQFAIEATLSFEPDGLRATGTFNGETFSQVMKPQE